MTPEEGAPCYVDVDGEPAYAVLHTPSAPAAPTGVVMLAPFGWEDLSSYRARRAWATSLAGTGLPVLRLDLPGTGDSAGGPADPGRPRTWHRAIARAAAIVRSDLGCSRVAAVGLGFGGLLACVEWNVFDDLILWGVPARGRSLIRELRAFAALEASAADAQRADPPAPDGAFFANGFAVTAEMVAAITTMDVATAAPRVARALVLARDGLPADARLIAALRDGGAAVAEAPGAGYGTMTGNPQTSVLPPAVTEVVAQWLLAAVPPAAVPPAAVPPAAVPPAAAGRPPSVAEVRTAVLAGAGGVRLRERALTLTAAGEVLAVVETTAAGGEPGRFGAVLLNAGAVRRVGPNRMWVDIARRWAARGVPTVRVDLADIGDAGGDACPPLADHHFYDRRYGEQITAVLDHLIADGFPSNLILGGLCSGAYWSFQLGQRDPRVQGVVLVNPLALVFDPSLRMADRVAKREASRLARAGTWQRVVRGDVTPAGVRAVGASAARFVVSATAALPARLATRVRHGVLEDPLDRQLDALRANGTKALLVFSNGELLRDEMDREGRFERLSRWPNVRLQLLSGPRDVHTLQAAGVQQQVHDLADQILAMAGEPASPQPPAHVGGMPESEAGYR